MPRDADADADHEEEDVHEDKTKKIFKSQTSKTWKRALSRLKCAEDHLDWHKYPKDKDEETCRLVREGIKQNRFCRALEDVHVDKLIEEMQYFAFTKGETIVTQGKTGSWFFVAHEGNLEVLVDGNVTNKLERGNAFGAIALIHNCPRTATVVATTVAGIWGISSDLFRRVLREHSEARYEENRKLMDCVRLFDGLSDRQKERVGELALYNEAFEAGAQIVKEGEVPTAVYIVKRGQLSVLEHGAKEETEETRLSSLGPGDLFGEQCLRALHGEKRSTTVVAHSQCEMVCAGIAQLKQILGEDLAGCLERAFLLATLRRLPVICQLAPQQVQRVLEAMEIKTFEANKEVPAGLRVAVVIDGELRGRDLAGGPVSLSRGTWCKDDEMFADLLDPGDIDDKGLLGYAELRAGDDGARLATLSGEALAIALRGMGVAHLGEAAADGDATQFARKIFTARKVPVLRNLSDTQINALVARLLTHEYVQDTVLFQQGDAGNAFFVVASGELVITVDGRPVRTIGRGNSFGERSLLFDEPRSASVHVSSASAQLWSIDRCAFREVVTEQMREEMVRRIHFHDSRISLGSLRQRRVIGVGGFGSVRLVEHVDTGMEYALKRVRKKDGQIPADVVQECDIMARMDHPFVIRMIKTFESDTSVYILMELVTGGQLFDTAGENMEHMNRKKAQFYIASLCLILEAVHLQNIVYRDLKPENVMLDDQGYLKLVDFGLAKKLPQEKSRTWSLCGTVYYMAPEIIDGRGHSLEVDLWALGVVAYEIVCGQLPFGDDCEAVQDVFSAVLEEDVVFPDWYNDSACKNLIRQLLDKSPETRLGSGLGGWDAVKKTKYFKHTKSKSGNSSSNLFNQIVGREVEAPFVPQGRRYQSEAEMGKDAALSDAEDFEAKKAQEESKNDSAHARHAMLKLTTAPLRDVKKDDAKPEQPEVKPPSKPREGKPRPKVGGQEKEATSEAAKKKATEADAKAGQQAPGKAASKLREEVNGTRQQPEH